MKQTGWYLLIGLLLIGWIVSLAGNEETPPAPAARPAATATTARPAATTAATTRATTRAATGTAARATTAASSDDEYDAKDYAAAEDFYYDRRDDFVDYEEAEEYWENHQ